MRVFALSDIHIDFKENRNWLISLSREDYRDDVLILAGDISDMTLFIEEAFRELGRRFSRVVYVPGNHDLWTHRSGMADSLASFGHIMKLAGENGIHVTPVTIGPLTIVPLHGWYDYSFGRPGDELSLIWMDYSACTWPEHFDQERITGHFLAMNEEHLSLRNDHVITFSHFVPRIDLMPSFIPRSKRIIYPVLGTSLLEAQIRKLSPRIHVYGHTHVNMRVRRDGILYVNNAFGYPTEKRISRKSLLNILEM